MARHRNWQITLHTIGLFAIALFTFHALSSLIFSLLGLSPSSPRWPLFMTLGAFLLIAGGAIGLQSLAFLKLPQRWTGLVSGAASIAILGCYSLGQLSGQQVQWALIGAIGGLLVGGGLGVWTANRQGFGQVAIALISSLCAYGATFGLSTWGLAAINTQRWGLALGLSLSSGLYLWLTQRALRWTYVQWRCTRKNLLQTLL